jgi:hypothetical protein
MRPIRISKTLYPASLRTRRYCVLPVSSLLLCSLLGAHASPIDRLKTIIGYDRICVLDAGQIAEFDTPTALFKQKDGIFRSMCDRSSITAEDIRMASPTGRL